MQRVAKRINLKTTFALRPVTARSYRASHNQYEWGYRHRPEESQILKSTKKTFGYYACENHQIDENFMFHTSGGNVTKTSLPYAAFKPDLSASQSVFVVPKKHFHEAVLALNAQGFEQM